MTTETKRANKPAAWIWQALAMVLTLFVAGQNIDAARQRITHKAAFGDAGFVVGQCGFDGFCPIASVTSDGPGYTMGIRPGDDVKYDRPSDGVRVGRVGETVGLTVRRGGKVHHIDLTLTKRPWTATDEATFASSLVFYGVCLITTLIGGFIILRSRRRVAALLIG